MIRFKVDYILTLADNYKQNENNDPPLKREDSEWGNVFIELIDLLQQSLNS